MIETKPINYYDGRIVYKVSSNKDNSDPKYAYCVFYSINSGAFKEDLLADFLIM